jgi:hypothetical protein
MGEAWNKGTGPFIGLLIDFSADARTRDRVDLSRPCAFARMMAQQALEKVKIALWTRVIRRPAAPTRSGTCLAGQWRRFTKTGLKPSLKRKRGPFRSTRRLCSGL